MNGEPGPHAQERAMAEVVQKPIMLMLIKNGCEIAFGVEEGLTSDEFD